LGKWFLLSAHNALHSRIDGLKRTTSDCDNCGKRTFYGLVACRGHTFDNGLLAFYGNFTRKGQLRETKKLRDAAGDHTGIAIGALGRAEHQVNLFLLKDGSKHSCCTQGIGAFERFYVADLDAIAGGGDHRAVLRRLRSELDLELWVDGGIADLAAARDWLAAGLGLLVLGSETQTDAALVRRLCGDPRVVLSLDFRGDDFLGRHD